MKFAINLQTKILLIVVVAMTAVLLISLYLHGLITKALIEEDYYNAAISKTVALARQVTAGEIFDNPAEMQEGLQITKNSYREFEQIDVFYVDSTGLHLDGSTMPQAERLPVISVDTPDNELGEMEQPLPNIFSQEIIRNNQVFWLLTVPIRDHNRAGYLSALVSKNSNNEFVSSLMWRHNLIILGTILISITLLFSMFYFYFRKPLCDLLRTMEKAQSGDLTARVKIRRNDEFGVLANSFNKMLVELQTRTEERENLLTRIGGFNQELHQAVEKATAELKISDEALMQTQRRLAQAEKLSAVGQMAASLAHEIGTPLNAVNGHLQLLVKNHKTDVEMQRRTGIIKQQIDFIATIVRRLLQRTQHSDLREMLDINSVIRESLDLVAPMLKKNGIESFFQSDESLPRVFADKEQMQQVLLNLFNNSLDAMPNGGKIQITATHKMEKRAVYIDFADSGEGFSTEALEQMFEPMWTTKKAGSGFGLSIVREILSEHGGSIEASAGAVGGASFRITLPTTEISTPNEIKGEIKNANAA